MDIIRVKEFNGMTSNSTNHACFMLLEFMSNFQALELWSERRALAEMVVCLVSGC